jgi:hypothetical protein
MEGLMAQCAKAGRSPLRIGETEGSRGFLGAGASGGSGPECRTKDPLTVSCLLFGGGACKLLHHPIDWVATLLSVVLIPLAIRVDFQVSTISQHLMMLP